MAEVELDAKELERKVHDLAQSMDKVKRNQAERDDVVVEMKHAKLARLELLVEDLRSVIEEVPENHDQFEFALASGETPRFWIDMTSHVRVGADRQVYEFVKDTHRGRVILARETDRELVRNRIVDYIAERILERERMIEGDRISVRGSGMNGIADMEGAPRRSGWPLFWTFAAGLVTGMVALMVLAWTGGLRSALDWLIGG